jgi:hypothetical protein
LLSWFATNKDALIAIAALVSPVVAVIGTLVAAFVSYRAIITGPRIQREISREQFVVTNRQLALQERTGVANLLGAADQKWIEDFRETVAEQIGLVMERGIMSNVSLGGDASRRMVEVAARFSLLRAKMYLLAPDFELFRVIGEFFEASAKEPGNQKQAEMIGQVFQIVSRIIEQKQAVIAARITALPEKS